mmetsp:Transcript_39976/g.41649  ORF Transcript_39976/g.41649 Transcript_39976/m.41649 type:complete len:213 (-) Transcript_39976:1641-2279(-)
MTIFCCFTPSVLSKKPRNKFTFIIISLNLTRVEILSNVSKNFFSLLTSSVLNLISEFNSTTSELLSFIPVNIFTMTLMSTNDSFRGFRILFNVLITSEQVLSKTEITFFSSSFFLLTTSNSDSNKLAMLRSPSSPSTTGSSLRWLSSMNLFRLVWKKFLKEVVFPQLFTLTTLGRLLSIVSGIIKSLNSILLNLSFDSLMNLYSWLEIILFP